jgi:MFS family permease
MTAAGLPIATAATIGGVRGVAQILGRAPITPLITRLGSRRTIVLTFFTAAAGVALLLLSSHLPAAIAYSILAGASIGAMYTLQGIYTNELVGTENLSLLMGAQQAVFAVAGAAGPLLAGALFQGLNSYTAVVAATAAGFLLSATIMTGTQPRRRERAHEESTTIRGWDGDPRLARPDRRPRDHTR